MVLRLAGSSTIFRGLCCSTRFSGGTIQKLILALGSRRTGGELLYVLNFAVMAINPQLLHEALKMPPRWRALQAEKCKPPAISCQILIPSNVRKLLI
jgi:hypothetical protein